MYTVVTRSTTKNKNRESLYCISAFLCRRQLAAARRAAMDTLATAAHRQCCLLGEICRRAGCNRRCAHVFPSVAIYKVLDWGDIDNVIAAAPIKVLGEHEI